MYLIGRYYDPGTGQFLNVDPMVAETGQPYAYAEDDPVDSADPTGLRTTPGGGIGYAFGKLWENGKGSLSGKVWTAGWHPKQYLNVEGTLYAPGSDQVLFQKIWRSKVRVRELLPPPFQIEIPAPPWEGEVTYRLRVAAWGFSGDAKTEWEGLTITGGYVLSCLVGGDPGTGSSVV
jgi:hypothetical protein